MRAYAVRVAALAGLFALAALVFHFGFGGCVAGFCESAELADRSYAAFVAGTDSPATLEDFTTLVVRNPASPFPWATLAEGLAESGDRAGARQSIQRAIERGPGLPQVHLRAANVFLQLGDTVAAAQSLMAVLETTGSFDDVVFDSFRRTGLTVRQMLDTFPGNPRAARAWFYNLGEHGTPAELKLVWEWALTHGFVDDDLAAAYSTILFQHHEYFAARLEWQRYLSVAGKPGGVSRILCKRHSPVPTVVIKFSMPDGG